MLICMEALRVIAWAVSLCAAAPAAEPNTPPQLYARWKHGPPSDPNFFPIAVWLQAPRNAAKYKAAGFNTYVGLWKGPTDQQLTELKAAGMKVICDQNAVGLKHRDDPTIVAWMHGDEPDNAQARPGGKGYGPPIAPEKIAADYERIRRADPARPVLLNLGQGVAWDGWHGRGVRTNHPEDYLQYVKGCDIASFDIYPAVHSHRDVAGKLWWVARGVDRLVKWAGPRRLVWNCIECTRIGNEKVKPTPAQVRAEVWMSIIHGSRGIIYFAHQFKPRFIEAGLFADAEMLAAVTKINREVRDLAPVINGRAYEDWLPAHPVPVRAPRHDRLRRVANVLFGVDTISGEGSVAADYRRWRKSPYDFAEYVFAVNMRDKPTEVEFSRSGFQPRTPKPVEVLGEDRSIARGTDGWGFRDKFGPYEVHIYRVPW